MSTGASAATRKYRGMMKVMDSASWLGANLELGALHKVVELGLSEAKP